VSLSVFVVEVMVLMRSCADCVATGGVVWVARLWRRFLVGRPRGRFQGWSFPRASLLCLLGDRTPMLASAKVSLEGVVINKV